MGAGVGGKEGVGMEAGEVEGVGGEVKGGQPAGEGVPLMVPPSTNVQERPCNVRTACNCGISAASQQSCATGLSPPLAVTLFARSA